MFRSGKPSMWSVRTYVDCNAFVSIHLQFPLIFIWILARCRWLQPNPMARSWYRWIDKSRGFTRLRGIGSERIIAKCRLVWCGWIEKLRKWSGRQLGMRGQAGSMHSPQSGVRCEWQVRETFNPIGVLKMSVFDLIGFRCSLQMEEPRRYLQ